MFELTPYERRHQRALFNPFRDMENFEKNFWGDMAATDFKTDIKDNGKEYVLEAELPGFKKEDIHVDIEDGYMTISAERSNETEKKDDKGNFVRRERSYGSFSRSFDVSSVKTEDITGEYKDPDDAQERRKRADIEKDRDRLIKSKRPRREYPPGFCVFICAFYKSYFIPCFFI